MLLSRWMFIRCDVNTPRLCSFCRQQACKCEVWNLTDGCPRSCWPPNPVGAAARPPSEQKELTGTWRQCGPLTGAQLPDRKPAVPPFWPRRQEGKGVVGTGAFGSSIAEGRCRAGGLGWTPASFFHAPIDPLPTTPGGDRREKAQPPIRHLFRINLRLKHPSKQHRKLRAVS